MLRMLAVMILAGSAVGHTTAATDLPVVEVDRDNFEIRESARVIISREVITDEDGNGVIHIIGDDLVVDFTDAHLRGAAAEDAPDQYAGIGVRITGSNITVRGGRFSGFKVAIRASEADGLTIENVDVSDNFRQRLLSSAEAASEEDALNRYENDDGQWLDNYGAGVAVERSDDVTIRRVRARDVQNGIILDRVNNSRIYDNDCSFLSGWGLALWRSSGNTISRNAFDFCVRDAKGSAGILLVEQCSNNVLAQNSATHGGTGVHIFAGREALGESNRRDDDDWYTGRGSNENLIIDNDLSYAAAHGVEVLYGFNNRVARNRISQNAISGVSADFSHGTLIALNEIEENGAQGDMKIEGGVNIEHGHGSRIQENTFRRNSIAVRLWARDDHPALDFSWAQANHEGSSENIVIYNDFVQDVRITELENSTGTVYGMNMLYHVAGFLTGDEVSMENLRRGRREPRVERDQWDGLEVHGEANRVGARPALRGRERIAITEWGPEDLTERSFIRVERDQSTHIFYLRSPIEEFDVDADGVQTEYDEAERALTLTAEAGRVAPYSLELAFSNGIVESSGTLVGADWTVRVFMAPVHPLDDIEDWRRRAEFGREFSSPHLHLMYDHTGPSQLSDVPTHVKEVGFETDRFGTIAETQLMFPAGTWRIQTEASDGVRVWMDGEKVIDDWEFHEERVGVPAIHSYEFTLDQPTTIDLRIEHFDVEGYAILKFDVEAVER